MDISEWVLHMCNLQLEVKWLKGIYLVDKMIKGFESQEKSVFKFASKVIKGEVGSKAIYP